MMRFLNLSLSEQYVLGLQLAHLKSFSSSFLTNFLIAILVVIVLSFRWVVSARCGYHLSEGRVGVPIGRMIAFLVNIFLSLSISQFLWTRSLLKLKKWRKQNQPGESGRPYWPHHRLARRLQPVCILVPGTSFVAISGSIFAMPCIALAPRYIGLADNVFGTYCILVNIVAPCNNMHFYTLCSVKVDSFSDSMRFLIWIASSSYLVLSKKNIMWF